VEKKKTGRSPMGTETKEGYTVALEPSVAEWLRRAGVDNLGAGIALAKSAAELYRRVHPEEWKQLQEQMLELRRRWKEGRKR